MSAARATKPDLRNDAFAHECAESMRKKNRVYFLVLGGFWLFEMVFFGVASPSSDPVGVAVRVAQQALVAGIWIAFRKPWPLRRLEVAVIAFWYAMVGVNVVAMMTVPEGAIMSYANSICLGTLIGVIACQLTLRPALAGCILSVVAPAIPIGARLGGATLVSWAFFLMPALVVFLAARSRERLAQREHDAASGLQRANERLRVLEETRCRLFVNLSHDFRTPLALIRGEAEWLRTSSNDLQNGHAALRRIEVNSLALAELTEQLLEVAQLDDARIPCHAAECDAVGIAQEVAAQHQPAAERGCVRVEAGEQMVAARADPRHVRRILSNLVDNAVRHSVSEVVVRLHAQEPATLSIEVSDDGECIAPEQRARIFERFVSFRKEGGVAAGLGLPLARELAELNGGTLTLDPDASRNTFRLALPAGASIPARASPTDTVAAEAGDDPREAPSVARDGCDLLVVEDHPEMRALLARLLGDQFRTRLARGVADAKRLFDEHAPGAILCDIMLPDGDGYEILEWVRTRRKLEGVPFLFVSALGSPDARARGLRAGADDYVAKPFSAEELRARVQAAVERAERRLRALQVQREEFLAELHDGITASLSRAAILLQVARDDPSLLEGAAAIVQEGLVEARAMIALNERGPATWQELAAQVRRDVSDTCERARLTLSFEESEDGTCPLVTSAESHAMRRIVREALTNVIKHAGATELACRLQASEGRIVASVEDNGRGIGPHAKPGRGIGIMRRRVGTLGGDILFEAGATGGTRIVVSCPAACGRGIATPAA